MPYQAIMQTPIGKLGLNLSDQGITKLDFLSDATALFISRDSLVKQVVAEIDAYFADAKHIFSQLLDLSVMPFQKKVLAELQKIPAGQVYTYGQIAEKLGTGARAVGNACRNNPVPIFIPCHRVVAATHLGGYSGARVGKWLDIKRWLLEHEGVRKQGVKS